MPENYSNKCPHGLILRATAAVGRAAALLESLPLVMLIRCHTAVAAVANADAFGVASRPLLKTAEPALAARPSARSRLRLLPSEDGRLKSFQQRGLSIA